MTPAATLFAHMHAGDVHFLAAEEQTALPATVICMPAMSIAEREGIVRVDSAHMSGSAHMSRSANRSGPGYERIRTEAGPWQSALYTCPR